MDLALRQLSLDDASTEHRLRYVGADNFTAVFSRASALA
jgi:hypothetical protein